MKKLLWFAWWLAVGCTVGGAEHWAAWKSGAGAENWSFHHGPEFPGAQGRLLRHPEAAVVTYDFSGGGAYLALIDADTPPPTARNVRFRFDATTPVRLACRVIAADAAVYQSADVIVAAGADGRFAPDAWPLYWNGDQAAAAPPPPWREVQLLIQPVEDHPVGEFTLRAMEFELPEAAAVPLTAAEWTVEWAGWQLNGQWRPDWRGVALQMSAVPLDATAAPLDAAIVWPAAGRDRCRRFQLDRTAGAHDWQWYIPLPGGGNPYQRYQPVLTLNDAAGNQLTRRLAVAGRAAAAIDYGTPRDAAQLENSKYGVCTHFSLGVTPEGGYGGWHDYDKLLQLAAAAGFKWFREECNIIRDDAGNWRVFERDLEWIKRAHELGLRYILMIPMLEADQPLEDFLRKVEAVVRDTRDYVQVYELGNEPQHAGNWRSFYGGSWNGKEPDGSTSPWVAAHLRYTNAAAERIKALYPEATVIGLGMAAPTNFRALQLGVTPAVDGVVDHAYTYSLPPERIPFGARFAERDGIVVGDDDFSFAGLVESYHRQFAATGQPRELWITEFGFSTFVFTPDNAVSAVMLYAAYSEEAQAVYLTRRFLECATLPVAVVCQYDLLDDMQSRFDEAEANFGLLRSDYTPKPAYWALQRFLALLSTAELDSAATVTVTAAPLHRAAQRSTLVAAWDREEITADNTVMTAPFRDPRYPDERLLAVWSAQPVTDEFSGRALRLEVAGWAEFGHAVAIDLIDGVTRDVTVTAADGVLQIDPLFLTSRPVVLKLFRRH